MPLNNIQALGYVILLCDDMIRMRDFYRDTLGLVINDEDEEWVEMQIGETLLSLRPRGRWYDGEKGGGGASVQLSFKLSPDEVLTAYQLLIEREVEILEPPTDQDFGQRTLYFRDPENNVLEIYALI